MVKTTKLSPPGPRCPIGDPANHAYQFSAALGPVFIPGIGEEDAAAAGLGVLDRIALETRATEDTTSGASWLTRVLAPKATAYAHTAEGAAGDTASLYRVSPTERGSFELDSGLDPDNFPKGEGSNGTAFFGNKARTTDFALRHSDTHEVGFRVKVPKSWLSAHNIEPDEWMTSEFLEYEILRSHSVNLINSVFTRGPLGNRTW